jgi:Leucine-rich repeat (LRR) protein
LPNWLPVSTKATLRTLSMAGTLLHRLPEGLCALQELDVSGCRELADDWLPPCSAAHVCSLIADNSNLASLPPGLSALTKLSSEGCPELQAEYERCA